MNDRQLKQNAWIKTQQAYLLQEQLINDHGYEMDELTGITARVFAYINADDNANISNMTKQISFKNTSLSTLKRSVIWLLDNELIYQTVGKDKRTRILIATEIK